MKFHEHTNNAAKPPENNNQVQQLKNPRGIQLEKKTEIQYKGAAGDAGNDLLDQSSSMMISRGREDSSKLITGQSSKLNNN